MNITNFTTFCLNINIFFKVKFLKFIRKEKKFKNVDQLRRQIKSDLNIAKKTK